MSSLGSGSKFSNLKQVGDFSIFGSKLVIFFFFLFLIGVSKFDVQKCPSMFFILCGHLSIFWSKSSFFYGGGGINFLLVTLHCPFGVQ